MWTRRASVLIAGLAVVMTSSVAALAADGDLDPGFSDGGTFQLDVGGSEWVSEIVTNDLGQIYAVGALDGIVFVQALLADGSPNLGFANAGLLLIDPGELSPFGLLLDFPAATIDEQQRLVISASFAQSNGDEGPDESIWVTRLLSTGALDPEFAGGPVPGHLLVDVGENEIVADVAVDDADRILVIGEASATGEIPRKPAIVRVLESGVVDVGYGVDGIATPGGSHAGPVAGAIDSDDRVVVAARSSDIPGALAVFRLLGDGAVDPSFATDLPDLGGSVVPSSVSIGSDNRIVVGGYTEELPISFVPFVLRLLDDGARDRSLHGTGWLRPDTAGNPLVSSIEMDSDDRIVIAADNVSGPASSSVLRLMRNGLPDATFGQDGLVSTELGPVSLGSLAVLSDGVLVGGAIRSTLSDMYVARLLSSGVADVEFVDDDGSVFESDIEALAKAGITLGCNPPVSDRFCLNEPVTRGQMAAFLVRGIGYTDDGGGDLFIDDDGSLFESDIDKLGAAGVTLGCNPPANDKFCPNQVVTRGQMAAFLVRALGYRDDGGGDLFVDDDDSIFESDVDKLGTAGVTLGCNPPTNDRFCPDKPVTRGQMAAFLARALDL